MRKIGLVLSAVIVFLLIIIGVLLFLRGNEDAWICTQDGWARHGNPSVPMPTDPCGSEDINKKEQAETVPVEEEKPDLIGGQKDEHGCLIGAGYSWCAAKEKCLRAWEEDCPSGSGADKTGIIEGSLSYPSEFIPDDMKVCAEGTTTKKIICTTKQIKDEKYTYGVGYLLEVPAGTYQVFASLTDAESLGSSLGNNYRAYYSEFVTCGLAYGCPSHAPINVSVAEGETVSKIDPVDWYKN